MNASRVQKPASRRSAGKRKVDGMWRARKRLRTGDGRKLTHKKARGGDQYAPAPGLNFLPDRKKKEIVAN
jgi:hypothetical protein